MDSRLEPYGKFILDQLLQRHNYSSTTQALTGLGCKTSQQNLTKWVKTWAHKLNTRRELAAPSPDSFASPALIIVVNHFRNSIN